MKTEFFRTAKKTIEQNIYYLDMTYSLYFSHVPQLIMKIIKREGTFKSKLFFSQC